MMKRIQKADFSPGLWFHTGDQDWSLLMADWVLGRGIARRNLVRLMLLNPYPLVAASFMNHWVVTRGRWKLMVTTEWVLYIWILNSSGLDWAPPTSWLILSKYPHSSPLNLLVIYFPIQLLLSLWPCGQSSNQSLCISGNPYLWPFFLPEEED